MPRSMLLSRKPQASSSLLGQPLTDATDAIDATDTTDATDATDATDQQTQLAQLTQLRHLQSSVHAAQGSLLAPPLSVASLNTTTVASIEQQVDPIANAILLLNQLITTQHQQQFIQNLIQQLAQPQQQITTQISLPRAPPVSSPQIPVEATVTTAAMPAPQHSPQPQHLRKAAVHPNKHPQKQTKAQSLLLAANNQKPPPAATTNNNNNNKSRRGARSLIAGGPQHAPRLKARLKAPTTTGGGGNLHQTQLSAPASMTKQQATGHNTHKYKLTPTQTADTTIIQTPGSPPLPSKLPKAPTSLRSVASSDSIGAPTNRGSTSGSGDSHMHTCNECGKGFSTSSNLARHRQTHRDVTDKKAKKCPECNKIYVSMPAFSMHVRTHNLACICSICGKSFSRPWLLQGHLRTHTGEKPFRCKICDKAFADKSNLRAHVQTHSSTKPYVCSRCNKAFALKSYLCKHVESTCMRAQSAQATNYQQTGNSQKEPLNLKVLNNPRRAYKTASSLQSAASQ